MSTHADPVTFAAVLDRTAGGWRFAKRTFSSWIGSDLVDAPFTFGAA